MAPTPAAIEEETAVVRVTESTDVAYPTVVLVSATKTTTPTPAFYVPAMFESANTQTSAANVALAQPLLLAAVVEVESAGFMQNWWQRGATMLLVCLGALAPFSGQRAGTRDKSASIER